jgi:hypothetical protein
VSLTKVSDLHVNSTLVNVVLFSVLIIIFWFQGRTVQLEKNVMCGRLVCDVKISAKELIRSRSYDLGTLCQNVSIQVSSLVEKRFCFGYSLKDNFVSFLFYFFSHHVNLIKILLTIVLLGVFLQLMFTFISALWMNFVPQGDERLSFYSAPF